MLNKRGARVANLIVALLVSGAVLYAAAKGFVSTLTRGHAKELIGEKIRVNGVAPGVIATPFQDRYSDEATMEAMRKTVPMGRLGTPEDCVGAYLFLASESLSGYIIGQIIEVNGGHGENGDRTPGA